MNEFVRPITSVKAPWSKDEFEAQSRRWRRSAITICTSSLLHGGKLRKDQVAAWALNRYVYQEAIPRKDAAFMSRVHDREFRREWVHRIQDHDGYGPDDTGGLERWLKLTDCLGFDREYVTSMRGVLPATTFAVEAYVHFVREQPLVVAAAGSRRSSSAPSIHKERDRGSGPRPFCSMMRSWRFQAPPVAGAARRQLHVQVRQELRDHARRAGSLCRGCVLQMRRARWCNARCAAAGLREGHDPAGRLASGRGLTAVLFAALASPV